MGLCLGSVETMTKFVSSISKALNKLNAQQKMS